MPALLSEKQDQLSTQEANNTRVFVTKLRWVVEVTISFLKNSFKALKEVPNKSLPLTLDHYKIAGALINKFFKRLIANFLNHLGQVGVNKNLMIIYFFQIKTLRLAMVRFTLIQVAMFILIKPMK